MRLILFVLSIMFVPIIFIASAAAFSFLDLSFLDPSSWKDGARAICCVWFFIVSIIATFTYLETS